MQKFRIRHLQLLVATDVAARGLDVDDLTHIINYTLPDDLGAYTHRSGRTGRAGKAGTSIAIINLKEKHLIKQIEKLIKKPFIAAKIPGGREICEKQLFNLIHKMENVELENSEIDTFLPSIYRKLEWLEKEDVIKRFVALEFNRFLDYYRNAKDINVNEEKQRDPSYREKNDRRESRREVTAFTRLSINLGKADGLYPNTLIELINGNSPGKRIRIGEITLGKNDGVFEVDSDYAKTLIAALNEAEFNNRPIQVDMASDQTRGQFSQQRTFGKKRNSKGFDEFQEGKVFKKGKSYEAKKEFSGRPGPFNKKKKKFKKNQ
jgi:ATP-dependent RNA helicase DeaD